MGVRPDDIRDAGCERLLQFEREGFLRCPGFLTASEVEALRSALREACSTQEAELAALRHQVRVHCGPAAAASGRGKKEYEALLQPLEECGDLSFLQYFNLHRTSSTLRSAALSPRLAFWAASLLAVPRVLLYQDALFVKRPGDGPTRWHSDLGLAPFDTNSFVTIWIALTPVPAEGGSSLCFAKRSHRDFALPYHGDPAEGLDGRYEEEEVGELHPGDATCHHGWTLHSADGLPVDAPGARVAWALCFIAGGTRLLKKRALEPGEEVGEDEEEDKESYLPWIRDLPAGGVVDHPMVPLVPAAV